MCEFQATKYQILSQNFDVDNWLKKALKNIHPLVAERLRNEFEEHYYCIYEECIQHGGWPVDAHYKALDALGSPEKANYKFFRMYPTLYDCQFIVKVQTQLNRKCIGSLGWLFMVFLMFPIGCEYSPHVALQLSAFYVVWWFIAMCFCIPVRSPLKIKEKTHLLGLTNGIGYAAYVGLIIPPMVGEMFSMDTKEQFVFPIVVLLSFLITYLNQISYRFKQRKWERFKEMMLNQKVEM